MTWFLNLLYALLLLLFSPWILWRRVTQGRYRHGWSSKLFGKLPTIQCDSENKTLWFHAVSVGELQVIRPLVERAERELPLSKIIVTTATDAGYALACKLYGKHSVSYAPMDFSWAISNALSRVRPDLIILAELELWPNWIRLATRRKIPIAVINGRLSQRSLAGYRRLHKFISSIVSKITWVGAQNKTYRDRFVNLGIPSTQVEITGNIKFDGANYDRGHPEVIRRGIELGLLSPQTNAKTPNINTSVVWLCGSTQSPEEQICLDAFKTLAPRFPSLKLILVPRHPERFEEVARLTQQTALPSLRRSQMAEEPADSNWRIFLADSVGELRWWWGLADIGFVGGSFGSRGGQNMIEPCAVHVATSFGPNTKNFADVVQILLEGNGAVALTEPDQLLHWTTEMIENASTREDLASRGQQIAMSHRGATERTWERLMQLLAKPDSN